MRSVSTLAVLIAVLLARPAIGQETTRQDFKKWCSHVEGRWIGDVTSVTDWPGGNKKGDKITAYWQGRVSEDGNVMVTKFLGGPASSTGMVYYDAAAKRIHHTWVDAGGVVFHNTLWPDGDKWIETVSVMLPDETKGTMNNVFIFTDGGKTLTIHINGKIGDDVIKDQKNVLRHVSKGKATE